MSDKTPKKDKRTVTEEIEVSADKLMDAALIRVKEVSPSRRRQRRS